MSDGLVLSTFSGIGMLDEAFRGEGYCVVSAGDVLWGSLYDIRRFHPPAGVFEGVIGGPPCQSFSALSVLVRHNGHEPKFGNLIPEFTRVVAEARPNWFLMENVRQAPVPVIPGYTVSEHLLNNRYFGAEQNRERRFCFGTHDGRPLVVDVALFEAPIHCVAVTSSDGGGVMRGRIPAAVKGDPRPIRKEHRLVPGSVTAGHGGRNSKQYVYSLEEACELQGLPPDFMEYLPFTKAGKLQAVANGVPLPLGRAVARAVRRAMEATRD